MNRLKLKTFPGIVLFGVVAFASIATADLLTTFTEPYERSDVATDGTGTIVDVEVKLGQRIKKGQVIARLNSRSLEASLLVAKSRAQSTARLKSAEAKLAQAIRHDEKLKTVDAKGHATDTEVSNARTQIVLAESEVELAKEEQAQYQADVERIKAEIENRITRSPFDGVVTALQKSRGEFVSATDPNIATVSRLDVLRVKFYIDTIFAGQLETGSEIDVQLGTQKITGEIEFVSPTTDPDAATVRIDVVIDNSDGQHRSGIPCRLLIPKHLSNVTQETPHLRDQNQEPIR